MKILIKADTNDADFIHSETNLHPQEKEETIEFLQKVAKALKLKHGDWGRGDAAQSNPTDTYEGLLTPEEIERFNDMCPYGEYGIHTIESIKIVEEVETIY